MGRLKIKIRIKPENLDEVLRRLILSLNLPMRSEILVPAFSTTNLGEVVEGAGHTPVYVDVDDRGVLDPKAAWRKVKSEYTREGDFWVHRRRGRRLAALGIVHPGGLTPELEAVWELAGELGLKIIDDARGALGAIAWIRPKDGRGEDNWVEAGAAGDVGLASAFGEAYIFVPPGNMPPDIPFEDAESFLSSYELRRIWRAKVRELGLKGKAVLAPTWCEAAGEVILVFGNGSSSLWPRAVLERNGGRCHYRKGSCPNAERLAELLEPVRFTLPEGAIPGAKALAQSIG